MNILALDLGTTTGWALRNASGEVHSGSQSFKPGRFEGGGMRYLKFSRWLSDVTGTATGGEWPGLVAFEEVRRHMGVDAAHAYGGFLASLTQWCEARKIPYQAVPVGTIKRAFTGNGAASKDAMMARARGLGYAPADDNEADAIAIMFWAVAEQGGKIATKTPPKQLPLPLSVGRERKRVTIVVPERVVPERKRVVL